MVCPDGRNFCSVVLLVGWLVGWLVLVVVCLFGFGWLVGLFHVQESQGRRVVCFFGVF